MDEPSPSTKGLDESSSSNIKFDEETSSKIEEYLSNGKSLYRQDKFEEAISVWQKALEIDPQNSQAQRYIERAKERLQEIQQPPVPSAVEGLPTKELPKELPEEKPLPSVERITPEIKPLATTAPEFVPSGEKPYRLLTLKECIQIGIDNSLSLKTSKREVRLAKQKVKDAWRALFPAASLKAEWIKGTTTGEDFTGREYYLELQQPIYQGGRLVNTLNQAKINMKVAKSNYEKLKNDLVYEVEQAYHILASTKKTYRELLELITLAKKDYSVAEKESELQLQREIDFLNVKNLYQETEYKLLSNQKDLTLAYLTLYQTLNIDPKKQSIDIPGPPTPKILEIDMEKCQQLALENRPDLTIKDFLYKFNKYGMEIALSQNRLKIDLTAGGGYKDEVFITESIDLQPEWYVGVKGSIPIWLNTLEYSYISQDKVPSAGQTTSTQFQSNTATLRLFDSTAYTSITEAKVNLQKAKDELQKLEKSITFEVKQDYYEFEKAIYQLSNSSTKLKLSEVELAIVSGQRDLNLAATNDLLRTRIKLWEAKTGYHQATAGYFTSVAKLNKTIGISEYFDPMGKPTVETAYYVSPPPIDISTAKLEFYPGATEKSTYKKEQLQTAYAETKTQPAEKITEPTQNFEIRKTLDEKQETENIKQKTDEKLQFAQLKKEEEKKQAAERQRLAQEREQKRQEEQKQKDEEKRLAELKKEEERKKKTEAEEKARLAQEEEKRLAQIKKEDKEKKKEEEKRLAQIKKDAEIKKQVEEKQRLAQETEQKKIEEQKRKEEEKRLAQIEKEEKEKLRQEEERKKELEKQRLAQEREQKRQEEQKRKDEEKRLSELKKEDERKKKAESEEKARLAREEEKRLAQLKKEEEKKKQAEEKQRLAQEKEQKRQEEQKRKAEEERLAQLKKEEERKKKAEAEEKARLAQEEVKKKDKSEQLAKQKEEERRKKEEEERFAKEREQKNIADQIRKEQEKILAQLKKEEEERKKTQQQTAEQQKKKQYLIKKEPSPPITPGELDDYARAKILASEIAKRKAEEQRIKQLPELKRKAEAEEKARLALEEEKKLAQIEKEEEIKRKEAEEQRLAQETEQKRLEEQKRIDEEKRLAQPKREEEEKEKEEERQRLSQLKREEERKKQDEEKRLAQLKREEERKKQDEERQKLQQEREQKRQEEQKQKAEAKAEAKAKSPTEKLIGEAEKPEVTAQETPPETKPTEYQLSLMKAQEKLSQLEKEKALLVTKLEDKKNSQQAEINQYLSQAKKYYEKQDYGSAIKEWSKALTLEPANSEAKEGVKKAEEALRKNK